MENKLEFSLSREMVEDLQTYSELLKKDTNTILNEALEQYFENEQAKLLEKNKNDHNSMTNLDYDEFWGGVEL